MDEVLKKSQEIIKDVTKILSETLEQEVDQMKTLEDQAAHLINDAVTEIHSAMSDLSKQSAEMQDCTKKKEGQIVTIQSQMKNKLIECYKKHYRPLDTLRAERTKIHKDASQLKVEAEKILERCARADEPINCFRQSLADLAKKAEKLAKKFEAHVKKEAETALKSAKLVRDCDERAIKEARQKFASVIDDIKKCTK